MRYGHILQMLEENAPFAITKQKLSEKLGISDRTLWTDIKEINKMGSNKGFQIIYTRAEGYSLKVNNYEEFQLFKTQIINDDLRPHVLSTKERIQNLEVIIIFSADYVTMSSLAKRLGVSISTIKEDLKRVEIFFKENNLEIIRKPHYGLVLSGSESDKRKCILELFRSQLSVPLQTSEYGMFVQMYNDNELKDLIVQVASDNNIQMNELYLKNIIEHVRLLIFRLLKKNYINSHGEISAVSDGKIDILSQKIVDYIENKYGIVIPEFEILYLQKQLKGKLTYLTDKDQEKYKEIIENSLKTIDKKYKTDFSSDDDLKGFLQLHLCTLIDRITSNHQLDNPLIDDIYIKYANTINIAIDFIDALQMENSPKLNVDELGYIAIYFAASLERQKLAAMENYRNIILITENGRGAGYLLETGIQKIFPHSKITVVSINNISNLEFNSTDLVITTSNVNLENTDVPVIHIDKLFSSQTMEKVEQTVRLFEESPEHYDDSRLLLNLFNERNFHILTDISGTDYMSILKEKSSELEKIGYAAKGFSDSVLEREKKINTIYENGVAGPHPMSSFSKKESIDVIILRPSLTFEERKVSIIFLINISQNHLTLHQEISKTMLSIINDSHLRKKIENTTNYTSFLKLISMAIDRR